MRALDQLPFLSHARVLNSRYETVPVSSLVFKRGLALPPGTSQDFAVRYTKRRLTTVYVPTDDLTFQVVDLPLSDLRFLANVPEDTLIPVNLLEVDYRDVLSKVSYPDEGSEQQEGSPAAVRALYPVMGQWDQEDLKREDVEAVQSAGIGDYELLRSSIVAPVQDVQESVGALVEEVLPLMDPGGIEQKPVDDIEKFLTNYIEYRGDSERVPVLFGNTAVAKSAVVKSVTKKLGRRLVDFRCAFMDKADIEGFRKKFVDEDGRLFTVTSPPEKILECTDKYLDYCETTAEKLRKSLANLEAATPEGEEPASVKEVRRMIRRLEEKAVPPVLFFDEVTRATKPVQQAFVVILNTKAFRGMAMSRARLVAATNYPVDLGTSGLDPNDPDEESEYLKAYATKQIKDLGAMERFEPIIVRPRDVSPRWTHYIKTKGDFDPILVDFLAEDPTRQYAIELVEEVVEASEEAANDLDPEENLALNSDNPLVNPLVQGVRDVGIIPFPNYRTWEFVNDHIRAVRNGKTPFNEKFIYGFIGKNYISEEFVKLVRAKIPQAANRPADEDFLNDALESSYETGAPILLMGMTSIGKTSRINNLAKRKGAVVVTINLAQKERIDIQGAPGTLGVDDYFLAGTSDKLPPEVSNIVREGIQEHLGNTPKITQKMPDRYLFDELQNARDDGKKVILFFDEMNRADKFSMSAVLEAVSDQKFGGVEFPFMCTEPSHVDENGARWTGFRDDLEKTRCPMGHLCEPQVIIAAACNYGFGYAGAEKLDPAISGRFSMIQKLQFDESDRESILKFMRASTNPVYPPVLIQWIEKKSFDEMKTMLESVETRKAHRSAPSLRALADMAKAIGQIKDPALQGFLGDPDWEREITVPVTTHDEALQRLDMIPENWAGLMQGSPITLPNGKTYEVPEFVESLRDTMKMVKRDQEGSWFGQTKLEPSQVQGYVDFFNGALPLLVSTNQGASRYRRREFIAKFGPGYFEDFLNFYNTMSGREFLDIPDILSRELADKYVDMILALEKDSQKRVDEYIKLCAGFYKHFGPSASKKMYQAVLLALAEAVSREGEEDNFKVLLGTYMDPSSDLVRGFFNLALDAELTLNILRDFSWGPNVDSIQRSVEDYYSSGRAPTGTDGALKMPPADTPAP